MQEAQILCALNPSSSLYTFSQIPCVPLENRAHVYMSAFRRQGSSHSGPVKNIARSICTVSVHVDCGTVKTFRIWNTARTVHSSQYSQPILSRKLGAWKFPPLHYCTFQKQKFPRAIFCVAHSRSSITRESLIFVVSYRGIIAVGL